MVPGDGGMSLLARSVGRNRALEIVLGAEDFDADTAAQYGCRFISLFSQAPQIRWCFVLICAS